VAGQAEHIDSAGGCAPVDTRQLVGACAAADQRQVPRRVHQGLVYI
jgi:hypothetical protein